MAAKKENSRTIPLRIHLSGDQKRDSVLLDPDKVMLIGRDLNAGIKLDNPSISRQHAQIECVKGDWVITDLGSRHGTSLNSIPLQPNEVMPLSHQDRIAIRPWLLRVDMKDEVTSTMQSIDDGYNKAQQIESIPHERLGTLAQRRLELLMSSAGAIHEAADEDELASTVLDSLLAGTEFARAAMVRLIDGIDQLEIVSSKIRHGQDRAVAPLAISRTLLHAAAGGNVVRLQDEPSMQNALSIVGSGVEEAMCVPVLVSGEIDSFLYMDSQAMADDPDSDAPAYCNSVSKLCGLAMANLKRKELERKQRDLVADLESAQQIQRRIMPPSSGSVAGSNYSMHLKPGRFIAGDFFGISATQDGETALFLGDVVGKGLTAGMMMASIQSHLLAQISHGLGPAQIVDSINSYICDHTADDEFASLWYGQFSPDDRTLHFVDAGHGYAIHKKAGGQASLIKSGGGLLVGIVDGPRADEPVSITFEPGDRLVLFSDGLCEQRTHEGEEFGLERITDALIMTISPADDIEILMESLRSFAGTDAFQDDVTIASIELIPRA